MTINPDIVFACATPKPGVNGLSIFNDWTELLVENIARFRPEPATLNAIATALTNEGFHIAAQTDMSVSFYGSRGLFDGMWSLGLAERAIAGEGAYYELSS